MKDGLHVCFAQARSVVVHDQLIHRVAELHANDAINAMNARDLLQHGIVHRSHQVIAQLHFRHGDSKDIIR